MMPFLRRVWYWVIILWLAELIYLKSNLMLYEENSKDYGDPWKTKKGNYQTDIFSNESVEQSLIRNCKSICTKLPKMLSEEEEMAKLSIEDRCSFMVASVQPKVSEYLALLGGLNLNLRNWVQYYQLEDWRRRWRLTLRSLQNYLHHLNHWKYGADRFREVRGDINAAIVKLDRVSSSFLQMRRRMLKKKSLQVKDHLSKMYSTCNDGLDAVDKHLICKFDIKALGYCTRITRAMLCLANGVSADQKIRLHTHQLFQFESYFQPLSNPCNLNTTHAIENVASGLHNLVTISKMSSRDSDEFPLSVPAVFRQDLILQTDNPSVWYMGQLVEFLTKPTSLLDTFLGAKVMELEIGEKPIAGLHVRRGDFSEVVAPQPIEKYLALVEDFFLQCDLKADRPVERRVFLATDDESVLEVVKANYPQYTVFTNSSHSQHAVNKWHGYYSSGEEVSAAIGEIILDTLILSKVDFFVGTLTSHVSKVVAMLRAARDPNAEESMFSLDSDFFIEGVLEPLTYRAVAPHNVPGEISFDVDTLVSVRLKHSVVRKFPTLPIDTNGFSYGILKQDRILGHFPMYKLAYAWDWLLVPNELRNASNWFSRRK